MPIFEFQCGDCGYTAELIMMYSEDMGECGCPCCGAEMTKLVSLPSYAKIKGSRVATTWCGKQGAAASV